MFRNNRLDRLKVESVLHIVFIKKNLSQRSSRSLQQQQQPKYDFFVQVFTERLFEHSSYLKNTSGAFFPSQTVCVSSNSVKK